MTDRWLDETISTWLEREAPTNLPDRVLRATFERTRKTRQGSRWLVLPRTEYVNRTFATVTGLAAVVVALVAVGLYFNRPGGFGGTPTPTDAPLSTAGPSTPQRPTTRPEGVAPVGPLDLEHQGMRITVTIPSPGWTYADYSGLLKGGLVGETPVAMLLLWPFPPGTDFYVPADPCRSTSTWPETPATTVDELVSALTAQPSRDASEPVDITIGGHAGKSFTLHVPEDAVLGDCEQTDYVSFGALGDNRFRNHQGPTQIDEFWILDVDGSIAVLDAAYRPETPAELVDELRSIAESASFGAP